MTTVWPLSRTARCRKPSSSAPDRESSAPVGSSAKTTCGRLARARAAATRCCWPAGQLRRAVVEPLGQPDGLDDRAHPLRVRPAARDAHRQLDVLGGGQRGQQVEGLEDEADRVPPQQGQSAVVQRRDLGVAEEDLTGGRAVEPGHHVQQRGLAGPRRSHDRRELAGRQRRAHVVERADGRVTLAVQLADADRSGSCAGGEGPAGLRGDDGHGRCSSLRAALVRPQAADASRSPRDIVLRARQPGRPARTGRSPVRPAPPRGFGGPRGAGGRATSRRRGRGGPGPWRRPPAPGCAASTLPPQPTPT